MIDLELITIVLSSIALIIGAFLEYRRGSKENREMVELRCAMVEMAMRLEGLDSRVSDLEGDPS